MKLLLATTLIVLTAASSAPDAHTQTARHILALNHAAAGSLPATGTAEYDYAYVASGLTGTRIDRVDLAKGVFVSIADTQGVSGAVGYDGAIPWQRDISGVATDQQGGDRIPVAVNEAYRQANLWWRPDFGGARISVAPREAIDGRPTDHLIVTPKGGKRFDAWFDVQNHLLVRVAEDQQFFHKKFLYRDHQRFAGAMLPSRITIDNGSGEASYERLQLRNVAITKPRPLATYARPTARPGGATIAGGAASTTVPFRLLNNHIYVDAKVNGHGPFTFIVDTGGHTLLSPRLIAAVGLKPIGVTSMSGAGEKTETGGFVPFDEIAIGGVRLRNQIGFAAGIYDAAIEGIDVDGMVGFELFSRMVTRIDYGRETITFTDPARFVAKDEGTAVPFVFYDHLPMVMGRIGDLPARLDIDTGSRSEIDITSPFVATYKLRQRYPRGISAIVGWGVGGPSRSHMVRLPSLTLGSLKVDRPTAGLSLSKAGSISDPNYDGNVGSGFLKRFVATFDYAHKTMYLKRLVPPPADAGHFDRSGMWINAGPQGFEVVNVSEGGPTALAGVRVGDIITGIDGKSTPVRSLPDARKMLRTLPPGTKVRLQLKRNGEMIAAMLVLHDAL